MPETQDERADRLAAVAVEMVVRVRDDDPDSNRDWLLSALPDAFDREALSFVLAAAVPDDRTWRQLTAWTRRRRPVGRHPQPCGTRAAWRRHLAHGEQPDRACEDAARKWERMRGQRRRAVARRSA